ncbi:MAG: DUF4130 domain-containing protein [Bacteroidota bacterium]
MSALPNRSAKHASAPLTCSRSSASTSPRYPAMQWAIVDRHRGYALVHDAAGRRFAPVPADASAPRAEEGYAFQRMWQTYFRAVTIPERSNPRLQLQHVPRRYWPSLTEMQSETEATRTRAKTRTWAKGEHTREPDA